MSEICPCGKEAYATACAAQRTLHHITQRSSRQKRLGRGLTLAVYRCPVCPGVWHMDHGQAKTKQTRGASHGQ